MNIVTLMGRLTAEPELKTTQSGLNYCRFTVAVDRPTSKDKERQTDFISCVAWRTTAEFICKYFSKGSRIALNGNIQTGSYEKDGQKTYTTDVIAEKVYFCESKQAAQQPQQPQQPQQAQQEEPPKQPGSEAKQGYLTPTLPDDLPF